MNLIDTITNDILTTSTHKRFAKERRDMGKSLTGRELGVGITQRKDGIYQGSYTDANGKRRTLYSKKLSELRRKLVGGERRNSPSSMTLNDWFDIYMDTFKGGVRDTTKRSYRIQYNRIRDTLGSKPLADISSVDVQNALNGLTSDSSRKDVKSLLVHIFWKAIDADLVSKNPAVRTETKLRHNVKKDIRVLSEDEVNRLKNAMTNSRTFFPIFVVALGTGMRIGEILGLQIEDVDFDRHLIFVSHTLAYLPGNGCGIYELHPTKTVNGVRHIPMTTEVEETLKTAISRKQSLKDPPKEGLENLIFVSRSNRPIHETNVRRTLIQYANRIGIEGITTHALRHTFASMCIAKGMKPKVLQQILGHAQLSITMDLYCHVEENLIKEEMSLVFPMA